MNKLLSFLTLIIPLNYMIGQVKISITSLPANTEKDSKIFMASSLNNWNPNDPNFELKKDNSGNYSISLPEGSGKVEYKFTQGSWETSEADSDGNSVSNRNLEFTGDSQNIENQILSWSKPQEKKDTQSKNVKILSENFSIPQLNTTRKIWIYLPPSYDSSNKKYPVIYMEDGQNLFNEATSFSGEWKVDETLDEFSKSGKLEAIVIGIDNGASERLNEYSPWKNEKYGGGKGELFTEFLVKTLKPYVDKRYRTLPQAKNTAIIGSSMGGLISLYAGVKYPTTFGKLGIFSPAFWFAENDLKKFLNGNKKQIKRTKFYFLAGLKESDNMVADAKEIIEILLKKGVPESNIKSKFDDYGTHSEGYWAKEFPAALEWLFGK